MWTTGIKFECFVDKQKLSKEQVRHSTSSVRVNSPEIANNGWSAAHTKKEQTKILSLIISRFSCHRFKQIGRKNIFKIYCEIINLCLTKNSCWSYRSNIKCRRRISLNLYSRFLTELGVDNHFDTTRKTKDGNLKTWLV